ncbi:MAG: ABC-ATPase UvrA, partial [Thermodesulfovibrionales bacterium]|nr:ABC-ATPase UvrA [Thermodesulfovibrionales bacterium]
WVVELGPGGGRNGGEVVFSGTMEKFLNADTSTAKYLRGEEAEIHGFDDKRRISPRNYLALTGAAGNNLKSVDFRLPAGTLTAVTGVSGSGKSSLVVETFYRAMARHFKVEPDAPLPYKDILGMEHIRNVKLIDQTPIGKSPRSNVLTYLKMFDPIRRLFSEQHEAKAHGYGPGFFSFNVTGGRCETCRGEGYQKMEMYFFEDLYVTCEACGGKRYKPEALRITYKGKNVNDILNMTVDEASDFFSDTPQVTGRLSLMKDIGLGYLRLGQPATTFSGGESQRIKICSELQSHDSRLQTVPKGTLYVLDEPTVGLHFTDVKALLRVLQRLVDAGNTVLVIEHNLDVIRAADWIIDLGPEGGERGGRIIFEGKPEEIIKCKESYTGKYLKEYVR